MKFIKKEEFEKINYFGIGEPNLAYAKYFSGQSYLNLLNNQVNGLGIFNVTFEPGCRNNWHIHHSTNKSGQLLICIAGEGWYQEEGKEAISLSEGSIIMVPPNVKH